MLWLTLEIVQEVTSRKNMKIFIDKRQGENVTLPRNLTIETVLFILSSKKVEVIKLLFVQITLNKYKIVNKIIQCRLFSIVVMLLHQYCLIKRLVGQFLKKTIF
jgi:hypothetical protein